MGRLNSFRRFFLNICGLIHDAIFENRGALMHAKRELGCPNPIQDDEENYLNETDLIHHFDLNLFAISNLASFAKTAILFFLF